MLHEPLTEEKDEAIQSCLFKRSSARGENLLVIQWRKKSLLYGGSLDGVATVTVRGTALGCQT